MAIKFDSTKIDLGNNNIFYKKYNKDNLILISYSSEGTIQWAKHIVGKASTLGKSEDGGFILGGDFENIKLGNTDLNTNILKFDNNGEVEWTKTTSYNISSIIETKDKGLVVTGDFQDNIIMDDEVSLKSLGGYDGILVKYDANNEVEWCKSVGGNGSDRFEKL